MLALMSTVGHSHGIIMSNLSDDNLLLAIHENKVMNETSCRWHQPGLRISFQHFKAGNDQLFSVTNRLAVPPSGTGKVRRFDRQSYPDRWVNDQPHLREG